MAVKKTKWALNKVTRVKIQKAWPIQGRARLTISQHTHNLPLCRSGSHSSTCSGRGYEINCIRIPIGVDKGTGIIKLGALCMHIKF